MDSGDTMDLVFLDFSKVSYSVNHRFLIQKLKVYGINDNVVNWIESFLHERTFKVSTDGSIFQSKAAVSGVPQESVVLFADDVKLIFVRANFDDLQRELQSAWDWALARGPPLK